MWTQLSLLDALFREYVYLCTNFCNALYMPSVLGVSATYKLNFSVSNDSYTCDVAHPECM